MKLKYNILKPLIILLALCLNLSAGQQVVFKGMVCDETGSPLTGANVMLKELEIGAATDADGNFLILAEPGTYTLEITYIGYKKISEEIRLTDEIITSDYGSRQNGKYYMTIESFQIGGITVLADKELIPSDAETKTVINSGEIEHIQASSLSDIMKLVPGQEFTNPGLQETKQVSIRTGETDSRDADVDAVFGTQIVIDGVPISNNANMQLNTDTNTGTVSRTTEKSGVDLRQIPADNIEEVEVIRGVPSAKYGDLTSGIVKVKTKAQIQDHRFKYKYNLQNKEANLGGGFKFFDQYLTYNLNYANSVRDIRIADFDYTRISGQLSHDTYLLNNLYLMKNRLYYTRTFDEQGLRKGDLTEREIYNRDFIIRYNHTSQVLLSTSQKLEFTYSLNYNRQNSYNKKKVSGDNTYISDLLTEGTQEGFFVQNYISELWVKGRAKNQFMNFEYNNSSLFGNDNISLLAGGSYRRESNEGAGRIFDIATPPSISGVDRDRPRDYSDVPVLQITSGFIESQISGKLLMNYKLNMGLRYERYGIEDTFLPSNNGEFFNPRVNLTLSPGENTQIRIGYGTTSKSPSLSMLSPNTRWLDVADINQYTGIDSTNLVVVSTYAFPKANPNLKGYQQVKREISFDQRIGGLGFTLTAYYNSVENGFASEKYNTYFVYKYDYPNWPDTTGRAVSDSICGTYKTYHNTLESDSKGIEFSVQTKRFTSLDMRLRVEAAYNLTTSNRVNWDVADDYRYDSILDADIKPFWNNYYLNRETLRINYRMEFTLKQLGAWITLEAQQTVFNKDWKGGLQDTLVVGYISSRGDIIVLPEEERATTLSETNTYQTYQDYDHIAENYKNIWLFNLRVSKSLFKGSEVSFFVNNIFNSHPLYTRKRIAPGNTSYYRLNPDIYFGIEFSSVINNLFE